MRVLLWPTFSYPGNAHADSLYLIARNLVLANPDVYWHVVAPQWETKQPADELDELANVKKWHVEMPVLYRAQEAVVDPNVVWRFGPQDGDLPVEAVISMSPQRLPNLVNAWTIRSTPTSEPVFVNWDLLVRNDRSGEITSDEVELMQLAMGAAVADLNVHESPIARKMSLDMCRKYLSPSMVSRVIASSMDVLQGVPVEKIRKIAERTEKRERFTVYYGGRLSTSKRFDDLATIVRQAYEFGRDIDFVVTTGSLEGSKFDRLKEEFPWMELHVGLPQEKAWEIMASCHTSICFSSHELFGMAFWEQMVAGLPVVMKAERWNEDLLPEEYPFAVNSALEAAAVIRGQYEKWEKGEWHDVLEVHGPYRMQVAETMDADKNLRVLGRYVMDLVRSRRHEAFDAYEKGKRSGLSDLIDVVVEGKETIEWTELITGIRERSRIGKGVIGNKLKWARSNAMLDLYRMMIWKGWEDTMNTVEPLFRRKS